LTRTELRTMGRDARNSDASGLFLLAGRAAIVASGTFSTTVLWLTRGALYGEGQIEFGGLSALGTAANLLLFMGTVLLFQGTPWQPRVRGEVRFRDAGLSRFNWMLIALATAPAILGGDRSAITAPALFIVIVLLRRMKHGRIRFIAGLGAPAIVLFSYIPAWRAHGPYFGTALPRGLEGALRGLASPAYILSDLTERLTESDYTLGSTYAAALVRQLPGPIARSFLGPPDDTGAFVYRDLIGYRNPDHGFGFSFTAEAYLNFGAPGVIIMSLILGLSMGITWRYFSARLNSIRELAYPVLVATLPYGLRSDSLTHIKSVLYTIGIVWMVSLLAHARASGGAASTSLSREASTAGFRRGTRDVRDK
jgi:hypothetical protein